MKTLCLSAAMVLVASMTDAQAEEAPFSVRGYQLGISLSDFKKLPYPDKDKYKSARLVCTGDKVEDSLARLMVEPSEAYKRVGVKICRFFQRKNYSGYASDQPVDIDFAGVGNYESRFMFSPKNFSGAAEPRLYAVVIHPNSKHFVVIKQAIADKYGKPFAIDGEILQNGYGAKFENDIAVWKNETSGLMIKKYDGKLDRSSVFYSHTELEGLVRKAVAATEGAAASKL